MENRIYNNTNEKVGRVMPGATVKKLKGGREVLNFTVVTSEDTGKTDSEGKKIYESRFHRCEAFSGSDKVMPFEQIQAGTIVRVAGRDDVHVYTNKETESKKYVAFLRVFELGKPENDKVFSLNKNEKQGYIGGVVDIFETAAGKVKATFNLATSHKSGKDENGNDLYDTVWHKIVIWSNKNVPGETLKSLKSGMLVKVTGLNDCDVYTNNEGKKIYTNFIKGLGLEVVKDAAPKADLNSDPYKADADEEDPTINW